MIPSVLCLVSGGLAPIGIVEQRIQLGEVREAQLLPHGIGMLAVARVVVGTDVLLVWAGWVSLIPASANPDTAFWFITAYRLLSSECSISVNRLMPARGMPSKCS